MVFFIFLKSLEELAEMSSISSVYKFGGFEFEDLEMCLSNKRKISAGVMMVSHFL